MIIWQKKIEVVKNRNTKIIQFLTAAIHVVQLSDSASGHKADDEDSSITHVSGIHERNAGKELSDVMLFKDAGLLHTHSCKTKAKPLNSEF